ncbi:MAG: xanthine dehydrogenase family protein molybdopterin-binding subunit [Deltaproteobacteria bacterium]|nr:xanthine dehydrogenase family protein molybdopterin-binding subunit [Deltaproteobacteria bacterium]
MNWIGKSVSRLDAWEKAVGTAVFGIDVKLPGMLHGRVLRSPHPHARIRHIDVTRARKLAGVALVLTGKDLGLIHGESIKDEPFLAIDKVRYVGEPVVAVAAVDGETCEEALDLVEVEYEPLPAVFDPEAAMQPDAPLLHERLDQYEVMGIVTPVPGTNIANHFKIRWGDVARGFAEADEVFEDTYSTGMVQHAAIEPHACTAQVDPTGRITVWSHNDAPHRARKELADALGLPLSQVRFVNCYAGGNFGSKGGLKTEPTAVALALRLKGKPVKVVWSREEVFTSTIVRHPTVVTVKTGVTRDGRLVAREVRAIYDTGAYAEKGPTVCRQGGHTASGPYNIPHVKVDAYCVYTNKPIAGAFRGYGIPQVAWAYECHMDAIAERLGIDAVDLRLRNCLQEGDVTCTGQRLHSVGLKESVIRAAEAIGWQKPKVPGRGRGLACVHKNTKTPSSSGAFIKLEEDGSVSVLTSAAEVGQGARTVLAQIAAEALGVPLDRISMAMADTDFTPYDASSTSSRTTFHVGNAIALAAQDVHQQLRQIAADLLEANPEDLVAGDGRVYVKGSPERALTYSQALKKTMGAGASILGRGFYYPKDATGMDNETGYGENPSVFWMYCAHAAEVEVDRETGQVRVLKLVAAHDVGKAINPQMCEQQIEGGVLTGLGTTLYEWMILKDGKVLNPNFADYRLPTAMEQPEVIPILVETPHRDGPFGAKGVGEVTLGPTSAAIANALYDAIGVRIRDLPITPEKVLQALRGRSA